jgi:hypothetical protein
MSNLKPIGDYYLSGIERYGSRSEYEKAKGVTPPPFNPLAVAKMWIDPAAVKSTERYSSYWGIYPNKATGKPTQERFYVPKAQANLVNMPPDHGADPEGYEYFPFPTRELTKDEELVHYGLFGDVMVKDLTIPESTVSADAAVNRILALVEKIAVKLGIAI